MLATSWVLLVIVTAFGAHDGGSSVNVTPMSKSYETLSHCTAVGEQLKGEQKVLRKHVLRPLGIVSISYRCVERIK